MARGMSTSVNSSLLSSADRVKEPQRDAEG